MKTITIIGINYHPEDTAIGLYTTQLAEYLAKNEFKINVITGFPYYPSWKIRKEYIHKKKFVKEKINNVNIYRYKQYVPQKPTFSKRILHLLDFTFGSLINILKIKNTDLVVCVVPFTTTIILGKILSKLRNAKLWIHIQDFEFDAAFESKSLKKTGLLSRLLFAFEKFLFNRASAISTISASMLKRLEQKNKKRIPKHLLPNWVDINKMNPALSVGHKYLRSKKFKLLYSGNIGEKQDWNLFIDLAHRLKHNAEIEIVLVGDGAKRVWLLNKLKGYDNVSYYKPVIYDELPDLLCSANLHVLFQKNNVVDAVMPSKILAMMASEKPSIITGNLKSEVASIIKKSKGGVYVESNQIEVVLSAINELKENEDEAKLLGENARKYVIENFSNQELLNKFKESFEKAIKI